MIKSCGIYDFRDFGLYGSPCGNMISRTFFHFFTIVKRMISNPIDIFRLRPEFVIAHLIINIKHDQKKNGHANSQSKYIDDREQLIIPKVSPGDDEIVAYHDYPCLKIKKLFGR